MTNTDKSKAVGTVLAALNDFHAKHPDLCRMDLVVVLTEVRDAVMKSALNELKAKMGLTGGGK